ncbi:MAG: hypothetical protein DMD41_07125 [Gemmatimonadetes bacterium]|nr:MAG: hypothetical protein DMD41_07125 [Gemmatimonadota bacterium]
MGLQTFTLLTIVVTLACHNEPVTPGSAAGLTVTVPLSRTELQPGQPDTQTFLWAGGTEFAPEPLTSPLPSGVYSVHAAFSAQGLRLATRPVSVRLN